MILSSARLQELASEEAKLLEGLSKRPLARQLVDAYLQSTLPELAALAQQRTITAAGDWVVIGVALPEVD